MKEFILGLETGLYGGSICLSDGFSVIAGRVGGDGRVKTDSLLDEIETLFKTSGIGYGDIKKIVVSSGPGSFTGLRIGYSVALGLKVGLEIGVESRFLLDDLLKIENVRPITIACLPLTIACLPFAKDEIIWKIKFENGGNFENEENDSIENIFASTVNENVLITPANKFFKKMSQVNPDIIRIPEQLFNDLTKYAEGTSFVPSESFEIVDNNFAGILVQASLREDNMNVSNRSNRAVYLREIFYPKK